MSDEKKNKGPSGDSRESMGSGPEPGAGELCTNLPNPYGYKPQGGKPSYEKSNGLGYGSRRG